jgi:signal recognition particle GTPase
MREIRLALLEADVNFRSSRTSSPACGSARSAQDVLKSLTPASRS